LTRVPENTLKFIVGVMLSAFGCFWSTEGAGATWPGSDAALLVLVPGIAGFTVALVALLRWRNRPAVADGELLRSGGAA
jgi:uncharacterized membrane protein